MIVSRRWHIVGNTAVSAHTRVYAPGDRRPSDRRGAWPQIHLLGGALTGIQYVGVDRIDLRAGRRTMITTDGGVPLAVAARSGRLVTFDTAGQIVIRTPTDGQVLGTLADYKALNRPGHDDRGVADMAIAGDRCGRTGWEEGRAGVADDGPVSGLSERSDDGWPCHCHVPRSLLSANTLGPYPAVL